MASAAAIFAAGKPKDVASIFDHVYLLMDGFQLDKLQVRFPELLRKTDNCDSDQPFGVGVETENYIFGSAQCTLCILVCHE